jgi:hypothetical protein
LTGQLRVAGGSVEKLAMLTGQIVQPRQFVMTATALAALLWAEHLVDDGEAER